MSHVTCACMKLALLLQRLFHESDMKLALLLQRLLHESGMKLALLLLATVPILQPVLPAQ